MFWGLIIKRVSVGAFNECLQPMFGSFYFLFIFFLFFIFFYFFIFFFLRETDNLINTVCFRSHQVASENESLCTLKRNQSTNGTK